MNNQKTWFKMKYQITDKGFKYGSGYPQEKIYSITPDFASEIMEYDPFLVENAEAGEKLYLRFANLGLEYMPEDERNRAIGDFCSNYGILGIWENKIQSYYYSPGNIPEILKQEYCQKYKVEIPAQYQSKFRSAPHIHAEPVDVFLQEYKLFKWMVEALNVLLKYDIKHAHDVYEKAVGTVFGSCSFKAETPEWFFDSIKRTYEYNLDHYLNGISPYVEVNNGNLDIKHYFPALINVLYFMLIKDFKKENFIISCQRCLNFFTAYDKGQILCAECKRFESKKRYEKQSGIAKQLKDEGYTNQQIAEKMQASIKSVEGWLKNRYTGIGRRNKKAAHN